MQNLALNGIKKLFSIRKVRPQKMTDHTPLIAVVGCVGKSSTIDAIGNWLGDETKVAHHTITGTRKKELQASLGALDESKTVACFEFDTFLAEKHLSYLKPGLFDVVIIPSLGTLPYFYAAGLKHLDKVPQALMVSLKPGGALILMREDPYYPWLEAMAKASGIQHILSVGRQSEDDCMIKSYYCERAGSHIALKWKQNTISIKMSWMGEHLCQDACAAMMALDRLNLFDQKMFKKTLAWTVPSGQMEWVAVPLVKGHCYLMLDYASGHLNALVAALVTVGQFPLNELSRRLLVLGPIQGIGRFSVDFYRRLVELIVKCGFVKVYAYGKENKALLEALPHAYRGGYAKTPELLLDDLVPAILQNDTVLVQAGSQALRVELGQLQSLQKKANDRQAKIEQMMQKQSAVVNLRPSLKSEIEIIMLGDTYHGESYQARRKAGNVLEARGYDASFQPFEKLLQTADLRIANLETALGTQQHSPYESQKSYLHQSIPQNAIPSLNQANIDLVSLANNHSFDYGLRGFEQTLNVLDDANIRIIGGGYNRLHASQPCVFQLADSQQYVAILAPYVTHGKKDWDIDCFAQQQHAGVMKGFESEVRAKVIELRQKYLNIFIIVFPHWGQNYAWKSQAQANLAKKWLRSGVDLVIGHGAHMLQEIEQINGKWVAYSIGNFVFNSPGRYKKYKAPPYGLITKLIFNQNQLYVRFYPILTDNRITDYQTRYVNDKEFKHLTKILKSKMSKDDFDQVVFSQDNHGHYLELPSIALSERGENKVLGMLVNITQEPVSFEKNSSFWRYRTLVIHKALEDSPYKIVAYSFADVDEKNKSLIGYEFHGHKLVPIYNPVPILTYNWAVGGRISKKDDSSFRTKLQFYRWMDAHRYPIIPSDRFQDFTRDKWACYLACRDLPYVIQPYTEPYLGTVLQLEQFINTYSVVFIKPQLGNMGNDIITLKKVNAEYQLKHYFRKRSKVYLVADLNAIRKRLAKLVGQRKYIIQQGIEVLKINQRLFDLRLVMLNEGEHWTYVHEIRVGASKSDLSNVSQGGYNCPTEEYLSQFLNPAQIDLLMSKAFKAAKSIAQYLGNLFYPTLNEFAADFALDENHDPYLIEINTKPGLVGVPELFEDYFNQSPEEKKRFQNSLRHGRALAKFLEYHTKYHTLSNLVWFEQLRAYQPLHPDCIHALIALIQEFYFQRPLGDHVEHQLKSDRASRIILISTYDGHYPVIVTLGCGGSLWDAWRNAVPNLPKDAKWVKLDIVSEVEALEDFDYETPLPGEISLDGYAFAQEPRCAFLPETLMAKRWLNREGRLKINRLDFITNTSLDQKQLYRFRTRGFLVKQSTHLNLYRCHQLCPELKSPLLHQSLSHLAKYLLRAQSKNGAFHLPTLIDERDQEFSFQLSNHARVLLSLLEMLVVENNDALLMALRKGFKRLETPMESLLNKWEKRDETKQLGHPTQLALLLLVVVKYLTYKTDVGLKDKAKRMALQLLSYLKSLSLSDPSQRSHANHLMIYAFITWMRFTGDHEQDLYFTDWINNQIDGIQQVSTFHPRNDQWLVLAVCALSIHSQSVQWQDFIKTYIHDWIGEQITSAPYLDWVGGVGVPPNVKQTAGLVMAIMSYYEVFQQHINTQEQRDLRAVVERGARFLVQCQIGPEKAMYLNDPQKAVGGVCHDIFSGQLKLGALHYYAGAISQIIKVFS